MGNPEDTFLRVAGKRFSCEVCGSNVFQRKNNGEMKNCNSCERLDADEKVYSCNGCSAIYKGK